MIDMKISEEQRKESQVCAITQDTYPYGLRIHLDPESYAKLKMQAVPKLGEKMNIMIAVEVVSVEQHSREDKKQYTSCSLQITGMDIKKKEKPAEEIIY